MSEQPREDAPGPEEWARQQAWLQEVGEASVLPMGDPSREAVEAEVRARGGWALAYWEALLEEDEVWRGTLAEPVDAPQDLGVRLKAIADQHAPLAREAVPRKVAPALRRLAVALLLLAIGGWALAQVLTPSAPEDDNSQAVHAVALLALNDHLDTHEQVVHANEPLALAAALQPHIPFDVRMPNLGPTVTPVGGRPCTLGSHSVAFSAWQGSRGRLTLIQLRRGDFGLPADMAARVITPSGDAARGRPLDVLFFGHGDTVWVVVADDAEDLRDVRRVVGSS